jgi:CheY-like chemotaxis protein
LGSASSGVQTSVRELKVLFVDDEPLLRQLVGDMLRTDNHSVEVADGGQEGLATFRAALASEKPFDVVITDLGMPGLDGRKLTALLKQESPRTPVIMLTGWGALMRKDGEMPAQVECVLSKPPRLSELRDALRDTISAK